MVFNRRCGAAARGSRMRDSPASSDVTDTYTAASFCAAIGAIKSRSRSTPDDLVTSENGCLHSAITSSTDRVIPSLRSAGW
jgi:hypothetical protein